jgi:hypothetical protein
MVNLSRKSKKGENLYCSKIRFYKNIIKFRIVIGYSKKWLSINR